MKRSTAANTRGPLHPVSNAIWITSPASQAMASGSMAFCVGACCTIPSRTAVYAPGLGSSSSQCAISCAMFSRRRDSASERAVLVPLSA